MKEHGDEGLATDQAMKPTPPGKKKKVKETSS
jgi:hypothetical protein